LRLSCKEVNVSVWLLGEMFLSFFGSCVEFIYITQWNKDSKRGVNGISVLKVILIIFN
jgi:hypothetical protein